MLKEEEQNVRSFKYSTSQCVFFCFFFLALQAFYLAWIQHRTLLNLSQRHIQIIVLLDFGNTNVCICHTKSVVKTKQGK